MEAQVRTMWSMDWMGAMWVDVVVDMVDLGMWMW